MDALVSDASVRLGRARLASAWFDPKAVRAPAFYRCWALTVAYLQAKGVGLSAPLDAFAVSVAPGLAYARVWSRPDPDDVGRWSFLDPAGAGGFVASAAVGRTSAAEVVRCGVRNREPRLARILGTGRP